MVIHCENFGEVTNTFIQSTKPASHIDSRHGDRACSLSTPRTLGQWGLNLQGQKPSPSGDCQARTRVGPHEIAAFVKHGGLSKIHTVNLLDGDSELLCFGLSGTLQTGSLIKHLASQKMRRGVASLTGCVVATVSPIPESGVLIHKNEYGAAIQMADGRIKWVIRRKHQSQSPTQSSCSRRRTSPQGHLLLIAVCPGREPPSIRDWCTMVQT